MAGNRTVPVETGKTYLSEGSGTKLMTISEFIHDFVLLQNPIGVGYLAQHQVVTISKYTNAQKKALKYEILLVMNVVISTSARVRKGHNSP